MYTNRQMNYMAERYYISNWMIREIAFMANSSSEIFYYETSARFMVYHTNLKDIVDVVRPLPLIYLKLIY